MPKRCAGTGIPEQILTDNGEVPRPGGPPRPGRHRRLSKDGKLIRVHPIRHDRTRELGAFANPQGRPRRKNSAIGNVS